MKPHSLTRPKEMFVGTVHPSPVDSYHRADIRL